MKANAEKLALRPGLRAARDAFVLGLSPDTRNRLEDGAARHLLPLVMQCRCVAFYWAVGSEMGCTAAIEQAAAAGIVVALPFVADGGDAMHFRVWQPGAPLAKGWRGLRQPIYGEAIEPDAFVVPLLGFDSRMRRLGQGGGFYDRALAGRTEAKKIGFGWAVQQLPAIPCDPWDIVLDMVVTERGAIRKDEA